MQNSSRPQLGSVRHTRSTVRQSHDGIKVTELIYDCRVSMFAIIMCESACFLSARFKPNNTHMQNRPIRGPSTKSVRAFIAACINSHMQHLKHRVPGTGQLISFRANSACCAIVCVPVAGVCMCVCGFVVYAFTIKLIRLLSNLACRSANSNWNEDFRYWSVLGAKPSTNQFLH